MLTTKFEADRNRVQGLKRPWIIASLLWDYRMRDCSSCSFQQINRFSSSHKGLTHVLKEGGNFVAAERIQQISCNFKVACVKMLTKFETKSERVLGLSFHPIRPWILASLIDGGIQLWDYSTNALIAAFAEHDGPVRGVDSHKSLPLFVSGGDDRKIKVWNYGRRHSLFTLLKHRGSVRTVHFHQEYPWIVSASDDKTIRIWNWETKSCISVLTGHKHIVTCASFHPQRHLILSSSFDKTVRVWDIASLRGDTTSLVKVTRVFEDHHDRVMWASFHPTNPVMVSGAKDHEIHLWRMLKNGAWEKYTLEGHTDTVSHVMFPAKHDMIVSASEDRSIRVWGATKPTVSTMTLLDKHHGELVTLAVHPEKSLLAAGHDHGLIIFKLDRKRPTFALTGDSLIIAKTGFFWRYDFLTKEMSRLCLVLPVEDLNHRLKGVSYSPREKGIVIVSLEGSYHMRWTSRKKISQKIDSVSALFITEDRFAVLEKGNKEVLFRDLHMKNPIDQMSLPFTTDALFYAGPDKLLCRSEDKLVIFDIHQKLVLGVLDTPMVRYVAWSHDMERVALLTKNSIIIASGALVHQCTIPERIRVKSGAWDENGVFIYTTLSHIKYCLPSGDSGIIKSLDCPMYVIKVSGNTVHCVDRDVQIKDIKIDATEYLIKLSLLGKNIEDMKIGRSQLLGHSMVGYLQKKGFSELVLHSVEDERIRFNLAIKCGNFDVAVISAAKMNSTDDWNTLGMEALRLGNTSVAEIAFKNTSNFQRLSFLYLVSGNLEKLAKIMKMAEVKNNPKAQFHNALYLGDVKERVKILENAGNLPLAYVTALVHGLHDVAEQLASVLGDNLPSLPEGKTPLLLMPPTPVMCGEDWPLLGGYKGISKGGLKELVQDDVPAVVTRTRPRNKDVVDVPAVVTRTNPRSKDVVRREKSELRHRSLAYNSFY